MDAARYGASTCVSVPGGGVITPEATSDQVLVRLLHRVLGRRVTLPADAERESTLAACGPGGVG